MTNIDWRAFWTSVATMILVLLIYVIFIEPVIKKYGIQIVKPNPCPPCPPSPPVTAKTT